MSAVGDIEILREFIALPFQDRWGTVETDAERALDRIQKLLGETVPYIRLEAGLQNSGHGNVIGNPAKKLLARIEAEL